MMGWVVRRLCRRFQLRRAEWLGGALAVALPTLLLDPFSSAFFPVVFPNMAPEVAGVFGGWIAVVLRGGVCGSEHRAREAMRKKRPHLLAGENLPAAPQQKRSLDKRERLKEAGLALFGEKGYEKTSIEEIARRAKLAVGGFYQRYRSKRQLLLALMDELLEELSKVDLRGAAMTDVRAGVRALLARAFSHDLRYLGAHRAWQEAALSDPDLARKQKQIHAWMTSRVLAVFQSLEQLPGSRKDVDIPGVARAMDSFFWSLLARAGRLRKVELNQQIDAAAHLMYHALFTDDSKKH